MNFVQKDTRPADKNPEIQRRLRAARGLRPLPLVPLQYMAKIMIDGLEKYVKDEICGGSSPRFQWLATEFPVYFPFLYIESPTTSKGTFFETRADAVIMFFGPPSDNSQGAKTNRVGVVEMKSVYGRDAVMERLPRREHIAQLILTAFMFWHNTRVRPDRVFLVYTTRWKRGSIFDYPFNPMVIDWQAKIITTWMSERGADTMYMDKRYVFSMANNPNFLRSPELQLEIFQYLPNNAFGNPLAAAQNVPRTETGSQYGTIQAPDLIVYRQRLLLKREPIAFRNYPVHKADFLPLNAPRTQPSAVGYRAGTSRDATVAIAVQGIRPRRAFTTAESRALTAAISAFISQLNSRDRLKTILPSILREQLENRVGISTAAEESDPPATGALRLKKTKNYFSGPSTGR